MMRVEVRGRLLADRAGVVSIEPRRTHDQLETSRTGSLAASA